jgi:hypothetical protein
MNARTFARTLASAAVFVAVGAAQAAVSPLDAGFYQGKPAHEVTADARAARYVDESPLAPTHYEGKPAATFVGTADHASRPYVDSRNPLDPSYRAK